MSQGLMKIDGLLVLEVILSSQTDYNNFFFVDLLIILTSVIFYFLYLLFSRVYFYEHCYYNFTNVKDCLLNCLEML